MSVPALGLPNSLSLSVTVNGKYTCCLAGVTQLIGRDGDRAKSTGRFALKKPKPFANSCGIRLRNDTSLIASTKRICCFSGFYLLFTSADNIASALKSIQFSILKSINQNQYARPLIYQWIISKNKFFSMLLLNNIVQCFVLSTW